MMDSFGSPTSDANQNPIDKHRVKSSDFPAPSRVSEESLNLASPDLEKPRK